MDNNSTYLQSETDITVGANPTVEAGVQNSKFSTTLPNITVQLQDLLATVMTAIQAESSKQTAAFQTKVAKCTGQLFVESGTAGDGLSLFREIVDPVRAVFL